MSKRSKIKPDEYYNDGFFELARFGEVVSMKNNMSLEQHEQYMKFFADHFKDAKNNINAKIENICNMISACDPLGLMNFSVSMSYLAIINQLSECQYTAEQNYTVRAVEYIQSILVATENKFTFSGNIEQDDSDKYYKILDSIIELYKEINTFYNYWSCHIKQEQEDISDDIIRYIIEAQLAAFVRGERYQIYEMEHLKRLLLPHNNVMIELFQLSANDLINGLERLQYSLSSAKADATNNLMESFDKFKGMIEVSGKSEIEDLIDEKERDRCQSFLEDIFGYTLYDVKRVTGWSDKIIDSLSYRLDEYKKFFEGEYPGWPIIDLPVKKKPFIKINGLSYCFDYYNLFDNIYRIMQKTIKELKPTYVNDWSHIQQRTSEQMVEELFGKLLPGSIAFRDNYYPKNKSLKECNENDVIVVYEDILFIIEVKAGSFTYTPAITDYEAHIKSFKALVEKADYQCERTISYIKSNEEAAIYDHERNIKTILKHSDFTEIYSFCVTVDNFNVFAAKAEKLSFINLQSGTIAISIDDLRVYSDYFDTPLYFLHYLKQRKLATQINNLNLYDELDHLGLYIKHNMYSITMKAYEDKSFVQFNGYREDIDNYFMSLFTDKISFPKPVQKIPQRIEEIIEFLNKNKIKDRIFLSNFLLDFASDAKDEMANTIEYVLDRQRQIMTMIPLITFGELRYCLFVNQPDVPDLGEKYKEDYVDASILYNKLDDYVLLNLYYDNMNHLENIVFSIRSLNNIPESRHDELNILGEKYVRSRIKSYVKQTGKRKIGRNEPCPCGSEKKYKKCCGR